MRGGVGVGLGLGLGVGPDSPEEVGDEDILRLGVELEQQLDQLDVELLRVAWSGLGLGVRVRIGVRVRVRA